MESNINALQYNNTNITMEQLEEHIKTTTNHDIILVLKKIACSPIPRIHSQIIRYFRNLWGNAYSRKEFMDILIKDGLASRYNSEELNDIIEQLEASRGYGSHEIKCIIDNIRDEYAYSNSQMTTVLEKLDVSDQYTILHYGTLFNNISFCKCIIEDYHCNVNLVGWGGETPLHIAARLPNIRHQDETADTSILLYLLKQKNIVINIKDSQDRTPLHIAVMYNCKENAEYLIGNKAKLDVSDVQGATPFHYACRFHQNWDMISLFLDSEKHLLERKTSDNKESIEIAAEFGDPAVFERLFRHLHYKGLASPKNVITALVKAAVRHRDNEVLSFLTAQYADMMDDDPSTLYCACCQIHGHKMVPNLINPQTIVYQDKQTGFSPLIAAVYHRRQKCVKELLKSVYFTQKAFQLVSHTSLCTVLHICAKINDDEITRDIVHCPYMLYSFAIAADLQGYTPLHTCSKFGNAYMAKLLLEYVNKNISDGVPISHKSKVRTMTNLNANGRVPHKRIVIKPTNSTSCQESVDKRIYTMLMKKNRDNLIPLHVAIYAGQLNVVNEILKYADSRVVNECDDQKRTCLHKAAEKGRVEIVDLLLWNGADPCACDIDNWMPLHFAAQCSWNPADNKQRVHCIKSLTKHNMAYINALTIRKETALHVACKNGSSKLFKELVKLGCNLSGINVDGYNCLEVAIQKNNEEVVRYLIEHEDCFDLMRNVQIRTKKPSWCFPFWHRCELDTPMRKLIREMPEMALLMLHKCTMKVGNKTTKVYKKIFVYEFLEDQYNVRHWAQDPSINNGWGKLYTTNSVDFVVNHPLFIMAENDAYDLMSHPLSQSLATKKFYNFGIYLFIGIFLIYSTYLGLFTTIVLRTRHPKAYYNTTHIDFQDSLCYNVSQALLKASPSLGGIKTTVDYGLKYSMYSIIWLLVLKNIFAIIKAWQIDFLATVRYLLEIAAVVLSFIFLYDQSYQANLTFRCPLQWQYGAFALLLSWISLLHYIQFMPIIGIYVTMLLVIIKKFLRFLAVLLVLISGFAFTFYMIFPNFDEFANVGNSFIQTAITISGEFGFDDFMYNHKKEAYYKVAYLIFLLFALMMAVFVTNLLIGLAVGEIPPLIKQAEDNLNKMYFQLVAECEIFRYQIRHILCYWSHHAINDTIPYKYYDFKDKKWYERLIEWLTKRFGDSAYDNKNQEEITKTLENQKMMLEELEQNVDFLVDRVKPSHESDDTDID